MLDIGNSPKVLDGTTHDSYHARFATRTIGPRALPTFAYTCAVVGYDHIVYSAIVQAVSVDDVVSQVRACWDDAHLHKVVKGRAKFTVKAAKDEEQAATEVLGIMAEVEPRGRARKFLHRHFFS
jgi:hypothetical protein